MIWIITKAPFSDLIGEILGVANTIIMTQRVKLLVSKCLLVNYLGELDRLLSDLMDRLEAVGLPAGVLDLGDFGGDVERRLDDSAAPMMAPRLPFATSMGERPLTSRTWAASGAARRRKSDTFSWPASALRWSGVRPSLSKGVLSAPFSTNSFTTSKCPGNEDFANQSFQSSCTRLQWAKRTCR